MYGWPHIITLFFLVCCAPSVERSEVEVPETDDGIGLAAQLAGTWQFTSRTRSTCPADLILNPFDGQVRISSSKNRVSIQSLELSGLSLQLFAETSERLVLVTTVSADGCRFEESQEIVIDSFESDRMSGTYTASYAWSDALRCRDAIAMYAEGVSEPCTLTASWTAVRTVSP